MAYYKRIVVFDLETGGLNIDKHAISEIAMVSVDFETLEIVDTYDALIKPYGMEYSEEAIALTGLSPDRLEKEGKDVKVVVDEIMSFMLDQKVDSVKPLLAGHNLIDFDVPRLEKLMKTSKVALSKFVNTSEYEDTLTLSRKVFVNEEKYNLANACYAAGITFKDAHRAMPDTKATAELLIECYKRMRGKVSETKEKRDFRKDFFF
jgi:DNA polymerase-3 subunit alpha (Gram-positive type)